MSSIATLDNATQVALDAIWKINIQECIIASNATEDSCLKEDPVKTNNILSAMEEGILSPTPDTLPMPPPAWLV